MSLTDSWYKTTTCKCLWTHRSTWWEQSHSGVLPGRGNVRRNCCTEISVPDGRWRHRICHCHYKTDQWDNLDEILDGKTGACPILRSVVRDSEGERPCGHKHISFWSFGMAWTSGKKDSARSSPETSSWRSYPHPSLQFGFLVFVELLVDKVAPLELLQLLESWKALTMKINSSWSGLAKKWWGGRDWAWCFHLANSCFFSSLFSLFAVGNVIIPFLPS